MPHADIHAWGARVGVVNLDADEEVASFQYTPEFIELGRELAPIKMPLNEAVYRFPETSRGAFHGLPGLLSDAIPDSFGQELIRAWLEAQGRFGQQLNAVEQLCYVGRRAMGALEFRPPSSPELDHSQTTSVSAILELAEAVLNDRAALRAKLNDESGVAAVQSLLAAGTSAGGRRPKALIGWNRVTNEVRSGQLDPMPGFEHWLIKFDGVKGREFGSPDGSGALEFAYSEMAKLTGIEMSDCELFEEGGRKHFITRRFDRDDLRKLHVQSLGALWHFDHHRSGVHSYENAMRTVRRLGMGTPDVEQMFRRMLFNIVARNEDDHVKNIAFLLDPDTNEWRLAPAFDLNYVHVPPEDFGAGHAMTMNGKVSGFAPEDVVESGETVGLRRSRPLAILDEVVTAVREWPRLAEEAGVPESVAAGIGAVHLLDYFSGESH